MGQSPQRVTGDDVLAKLSALANPQRLRIIATLQAGGRNYVSQLARDIGISRPLLNLHLQKLEAAGLVVSDFEVSDDGKALRYFSVADFNLVLDAAKIAGLAETLTIQSTKST